MERRRYIAIWTHELQGGSWAPLSENGLKEIFPGIGVYWSIEELDPEVKGNTSTAEDRRTKAKATITTLVEALATEERAVNDTPIPDECMSDTDSDSEADTELQTPEVLEKVFSGTPPCAPDGGAPHRERHRGLCKQKTTCPSRMGRSSIDQGHQSGSRTGSAAVDKHPATHDQTTRNSGHRDAFTSIATRQGMDLGNDFEEFRVDTVSPQDDSTLSPSDPRDPTSVRPFLDSSDLGAAKTGQRRKPSNPAGNDGRDVPMHVCGGTETREQASPPSYVADLRKSRGR
jgi:hypothetical protein